MLFDPQYEEPFISPENPSLSMFPLFHHPTPGTKEFIRHITIDTQFYPFLIDPEINLSQWFVGNRRRELHSTTTLRGMPIKSIRVYGSQKNVHLHRIIALLSQLDESEYPPTRDHLWMMLQSLPLITLNNVSEPYDLRTSNIAIATRGRKALVRQPLPTLSQVRPVQASPISEPSQGKSLRLQAVEFLVGPLSEPDIQNPDVPSHIQTPEELQALQEHRKAQNSVDDILALMTGKKKEGEKNV